jgi:hypothetical protein
MNHNTPPKRRVMAWTIALWAFGTGVYAYIYVASRLALPDAVGNETDWSWQLFSSPLFASPFSYWYSVHSSMLSTGFCRVGGHPTVPPNRPLERAGMIAPWREPSSAGHSTPCVSDPNANS